MNQQLKKIKLKIHGMHCASCEVLIERKWKDIPGVEKVRVNHANGKAEMIYSREPNVRELANAIKADGYAVSLWHDRNIEVELPHKNTKKDYFHIGAIFLIVVALYLILQQFNLVPKLGISDNMSYGFVFLVGLVAAVSTCIAVTGGLLLSLAAKYNEKHPAMSGVQKFKPHIYFNAGRIVSYAVLGGAIGLLGSVISLSPKTNGILTILVSVVMLILGFQLLKLFPWMRRFQIKMPKAIAHRIHDWNAAETKSGPFLLGGATFFLPCGFTQALQLYVLAKGDSVTGALTMFFFALGTLPALVSLGAVSSFTRGSFQQYFLKFAGVVVILLGSFNIQNGFALTGVNINFAAAFQAVSPDQVADRTERTSVEIIDGKQIARMKITGLDYFPHQFTVVEGVPVVWEIDGREAEGCAQVVTMPSLGITKYISRTSPTTIAFTPKETGRISFSCSMGMTTYNSYFEVVPNTTGIAGGVGEATVGIAAFAECDPKTASCVPSQKLAMEVSNERGFYPNTFTVKKGAPVELTIDVQVPLGGCMSTIILPKYDVGQPLVLGKNTIRFTPTEAGEIFATCSMGSKMVRFTVTE